ncbi:MAG: hypothetical protein ACK5NK_08170 [Niabella sp.]
MRLRNQILSMLNSGQDFLADSSACFDESVNGIETSFNQIFSTILNAIYTQTVVNGRIEELYRIARNCSMVEFHPHHILDNRELAMKGNGANSELFGGRFGIIVDIIAHHSGVKSCAVKKMFSVLTPIILSNFYFTSKANNYTKSQFIAFIQKHVKKNKISRDLQGELHSLIKNTWNEVGAKETEVVSLSVFSGLFKGYEKWRNKMYSGNVAGVN